MFLQLIIFLLQQQYVKLNYRYKKKKVLKLIWYVLNMHFFCIHIQILDVETDIEMSL